MLPLLIGAGAGLLKSELVDRPRDDRNRKMNAEIARYSPWTHMSPDLNNMNSADPLGSMMQGGMAGAMMGQSMGGAGEAAAGSEGAGSAGAVGSSGGMSSYSNPMQQKYPWAF